MGLPNGRASESQPAPADIQLMPACKRHFSALPLLTYINARCAPFLKKHHFRLGPS
jgi:hypothetical protein